MPIPGARRSTSIALPGARAAQVGFIQGGAFAPPIGFPWPGAAVDLDFVRRQYRWNNASRTEADFTTLVLNGATWGAQGLDISTAAPPPDITIALASLGISIPPVAYAFGGYFLSSAGAVKTIFQFDDGTNNDRLPLSNTAANQIVMQSIDNGTIQSAQGAGIFPGVARFGVAFSIQTNEVLSSGNGVSTTPDTAATMPTMTTLRIGKSLTAGSNMAAILSRLVVFTAVKTQAECDQLSIQIRDAP